MNDKWNALQDILGRSIDNKKIFGTSFSIRYKDEKWCGSAGNMDCDTPYFIASTTKLFTTAVILNLRSKGLLNLDEKISTYIAEDILDSLHIYKGVDYSGEITIKHLLAHTSGLPDYFEDKNKSGVSLENKLLTGEDKGWSFEESIDISKNLQPLFKPGEKNKAHYSDTNFQLLGKIIENITDKPLSDNYDDIIIKPLGLTKTYLYKNVKDNTPINFHYKEKELHLPKAMTSFGSDGGIVSTSEDLLTFIEAFFTGCFFPAEYIDELQVWNRIFFPFRAGVGIHLFKLSWIFDPMHSVSDLIGHSGLSGALAYYCPKHNLYIAGTVNQVAYRDMSFRTAIKLIQKIKNL